MQDSHRLRVIDAIRGFSVVSMVLFHLCYDLYFLYGVPLGPVFEPPLRDVWRASISWVFLFVAGLMCSCSRDNLRRAARYGLVALLIWVVTTVAKLDDPINFGIIFCMAASTLIAWMLQWLGALGSSDTGASAPGKGSLVAAVVLAALFACCLPLAQGWIGLGGLHVAVPVAAYSTPWLSWLGLPGPGFVSSDYYPVLPYSLLYLAGACVGAHVMAHGGWPGWCYRLGCRPLEFVGRHALEVYVLHQAAIFAVLAVVLG